MKRETCSIKTRRWAQVVSLIAPIGLLIGSGTQAQCPTMGWQPIPGLQTYATVRALIEHDDGTGNALYVGGLSIIEGAGPGKAIARWDGTTWSQVGAGLTSEVRCLTVADVGNGPHLYAGSDKLYRWDGTTWTLMIGSPAFVSSVMTVNTGVGDRIFVAGNVSSTTYQVGRWDGQTWMYFDGTMNGPIRALALHDDGSGEALYAAGDFTSAGVVAVNKITKWNGQGWAPVGSGFPFSSVHSLTRHFDGADWLLYAGTGNGASKWNGDAWQSMGLNGTTRTLLSYITLSDNVLYAAGTTLYSSSPAILNSVAVHSNGSWKNLGIGIEGVVHATTIATLNDETGLYVGGNFQGAGNWPASHLAVWKALGDIIDLNQNALVDACEFANGMVMDCNRNSIPDDAEPDASYVLDNGTPGFAFSTPGLRDFLWMNQFDVQSSREIITHVAVPWSQFGRDASPVTVLLYADPNQDGDPSDAALLAAATAPHIYTGLPIGTFANVPIAATYVGEAGTSFFVAALTQTDQNVAVPISDTGPSLNRSWYRIDPPGEIDPNHPSTGKPIEPFSASFFLRAVSVDCNANSIWDQCDIDNGTSFDLNRNGVPDECEIPVVCAGDVNIDEVVNVVDLLIVINAWGACPAPPASCAADIAPPGPPPGDGIVNVADLLTVINAWGPCR